MATKIILLLIFLQMQFNVFSQIYNISIEDRNKAIVLTKHAIEKINENNLGDAFSNLVDAISVDSVFRPPYLQLYRICLLDIKYSKPVILCLKKAKSIFTDDDEISFYLGEIYRINSDLKNAMIEYNAAINFSKINGEDFNLVYCYYFNRGNCYLKKEMPDSALIDYNYTLKLKPEYSLALVNRGICFFKKGNSKEACEDWGKSIELGCFSANEYFEKYCKNSKQENSLTISK